MAIRKHSTNTRRRKSKTLAGTHLFLDPRTGIYIWRRSLGGKRVSKTTGCKELTLALRKAGEFEDEHAKQRAGLKTYTCWSKRLDLLVPPFVDSRKVNAKGKKQYDKDLRRALVDLKLDKAADLDDLAALSRRLDAVDATLLTKRRCYQNVLRRFASWLAEDKRHIDRDPLENWKLVDLEGVEPVREARAPMPEEINRAMLALDLLDVVHSRKHPQRPVFTALLVTPQRATAFVTRDVEHLDGDRIEFGAGTKKKRRGAGALDPKTADELEDYAADSGPLFRSPRGGRWKPNKMNKAWQEAFGLGIVCHLWPADVEPDVNLAHFTNQVLLKGKAPVNNGGTRVSDEIKAQRRGIAQTASQVAESIGEQWNESMHGVYVHGLRHTHRTWAEAAGVQPRSIDKQLGHAKTDDDSTDEFTRFLVGSKTGRRHYVDKASALFNPADSANAVRAMLDQAEALEPALLARILASEIPSQASRAL